MAKAKLLDPKLEAAGAKLKASVATTARAAGSPGSFLMSIVRSMILPVLPLVIAELLKSANAKTKKILIIVRDILTDTDLGDA